jgi:hypothetical protein
MIMKKLISIFALLCLLISPTFSQIGIQFKFDVVKKSFYKMPFSWDVSNDYKSLSNYSKSESKQFIPNFIIKDLSTNKNKPSSNILIHNEMPCLIPDGSFSMKIMTPDSSKRYSLLIKKL